MANQRKNFLHHNFKELSINFDVVAIEDLNMKGMLQALHFGKSVADNAWGMFTSSLAYKINEQGKQLVEGNHLSLSERVYSCICNVNLDRDYNAAINVKNEAIRLLALA